MSLPNLSLIRAIKIQNTIKWLCIIGGIIGIILAGVVFHMKQEGMVQVTKPVKGVSPKP